VADADTGDNRAKLLNCALRLFVAYGYDGVGIQQIVEAAGVTKPTLYHYFGSKLGLLETILREQLEELHDSLMRAAAYRHDLPRTLNEVAQAVFAFAKAHPEPYRLHLSLWFAPAESEAYQAVLRFHKRQFAVMEKVFLEASNDHGNMKGRHRAYAVTFLGMLNNYVSLALSGHTKLDAPLAYRSVHQFMHGIFS
jgi:TetR/AcrR family transcriptional regulator